MIEGRIEGVSGENEIEKKYNIVVRFFENEAPWCLRMGVVDEQKRMRRVINLTKIFHGFVKKISYTAQDFLTLNW